MAIRRFPALACSLAATLAVHAVHADLITIDVNTNGTLLNRNVYGTTLNNGTASWPLSNTAYRD